MCSYTWEVCVECGTPCTQGAAKPQASWHPCAMYGTTGSWFTKHNNNNNINAIMHTSPLHHIIADIGFEPCEGGGQTNSSGDVGFEVGFGCEVGFAANDASVQYVCP